MYTNDSAHGAGLEDSARRYLSDLAAQLGDDWLRVVVLIAQLRRPDPSEKPRTQVMSNSLRWDGERAVQTNCSPNSDWELMEQVYDELQSGEAWTEAFLVLDRDGVMQLLVEDIPTLSTEDPLSHPHWDRVDEHEQFCAEDVAAMVERLRHNHDLPGRRRSPLAFFRRS